jgi:hypothetical protein
MKYRKWKLPRLGHQKHYGRLLWYETGKAVHYGIYFGQFEGLRQRWDRTATPHYTIKEDIRRMT